MKFLIIGESVSLAHTVRPLQVSEDLATLGHDVCFAFDEREFRFPISKQIRTRHLPCIGSKTFLSRIRSSRIPYERSDLTEYIRADRALIEAESPDFIIHDFRITLQFQPALTSRRLCALTNIYWAEVPDRTFSMPAPQCGLVGKIGLSLPDAIGGLLGFVADRVAAPPFDALAKEHGLVAKRRFSRYLLNADYRLFVDPPDLFPQLPRRSTDLFIGHVDWAPAADAPKRAYDVFVALGSSGPTWLLSEIVTSLGEIGKKILVCTGVHASEAAADKAFESEHVTRATFIDGYAASEHAELVICNGGSPAVYQALSAGARVIGIPSNFDQALCMQQLAHLPHLRSIPSATFSPERLKATVRELYATPKPEGSLDASRGRAFRLEALSKFVRHLARNQTPQTQKVAHVA